MIQNTSRNKRKVKPGRIILIILVPVIIIGLAFGVYKFMTNSPYAQYDKYNSDTKTAGEMNHDSVDKDEYYLSVYYPKYENSVLDNVVKEYREKNVMKSLKMDGKYFVNVDYDSAEIYKGYTTLTFHQKVYDKDDKLVKQEDVSYNYDKNLDKIMTVKDVLRRDFMDVVRKSAKAANIDIAKLTMDSLNNFILGEKNVTFYLDNNASHKFSINYQDNKKYIALTNKNIPSLYQKDPIIPAKQPTIDPKKPMIAFTFDDGPQGDDTLRLMEAFEKYGGRCTFYMLGPMVEARPDVTQQIYKRGFELGSHTWTHDSRTLSNMSKEELNKEILGTQDVIFKVTGADPLSMRPPYGAYNQQVLEITSVPAVIWYIDTLDWQSKNTEATKKAILDRVTDGAIILQHDIHATSVEAAIQLLPILKEKGYQFVTMETLMKYQGDALIKEGYVIPSQYK